MGKITEEMFQGGNTIFAEVIKEKAPNEHASHPYIIAKPAHFADAKAAYAYCYQNPSGVKVLITTEEYVHQAMITKEWIIRNCETIDESGNDVFAGWLLQL